MATKINKLAGSQIEITATISAKDLSAYRVQAVKNLGEEVKIDGFRKGKVPEQVLIEKLGEMTLLYEIAELAIGDAYPKILEEEKIDAIGRPEVKITKIAKDAPLEFTITTAVTPDVKVGDYTAIAKAEMKKELDIKEVTDDEVEKVILEIQKQQTHTHDDGKEHIPELDDEFVKSLGNFENVDDFRKKIKENLNKEKEHRAFEKRRLDIAEKILETANVDLPRIMVEHELSRSEAQFKDDISRLGVKVEDYLARLKKTMEDLKKESKMCHN
jgi:FKBP-type peptidyl-prolyl cis-trans isomerase (trigger factor)